MSTHSSLESAINMNRNAPQNGKGLGNKAQVAQTTAKSPIRPLERSNKPRALLVSLHPIAILSPSVLRYSCLLVGYRYSIRSSHAAQDVRCMQSASY